MKKPMPRTAAEQTAYLKAGSEAVAERIVSSLKRELAKVSPKEKAATYNRWMLRTFGPGIAAVGVLADETPKKRPKKARAKRKTDTP
ncbi:MAG TPA: hypothetical protein VF815_31285 [Myxococcaceae bacterium]